MNFLGPIKDFLGFIMDFLGLIMDVNRFLIYSLLQ